MWTWWTSPRSDDPHRIEKSRPRPGTAFLMAEGIRCGMRRSTACHRSPGRPIEAGERGGGADRLSQALTAHRSHYTNWNNRIEYHRFELWTAFIGRLSMAPVGDRQTLDAQSSECRLRPPTGLRIAARTAFANAGSMWAAAGLHSTWNSSPAPYRQRSADPTKNRTELYIPSCFLLFV